jgi:hypothetical protein
MGLTELVVPPEVDVALQDDAVSIAGVGDQNRVGREAGPIASLPRFAHEGQTVKPELRLSEPL